MTTKPRQLIVYFLATIISLIPLVLLLHIILKPGYIIFTDVTEGLKLDHLYERYIYTYSNDIGDALAEKARIPLFYLTLVIFKLSQLNDPYYIKIKFAVLIVVTTLSYLIGLKNILETKNGSKPNPTHLLISFIFGNLFYLTNYWATNRLTHFYLFFSSAGVILTFGLYYNFLFSKSVRIEKLIILCVLLSIFSATPHTPILTGIIFVSLTLVFLLQKNTDWKEKLIKIKFLPAFFICYLLVNLYWIVPFTVSKMGPDAILSTDMVNLLARNNTLLNQASLKGYWWQELSEYPINKTLIAEALDLISSWLPLAILGSLCFIKTKSKLKQNIFVLFIISLVLGSKNILSANIYNFLMFHSPIKSIGWLFRELDKIGLLLTLCYSITISFLVFLVMSKKKFRAIIITLVTILLINHLFYFGKIVKRYYTPQRPPAEFSEANKILEKDLEEFNVLWYPGIEQPWWLKTRENRFVFTNLLSVKPTITTRSDLIFFFDYVFNNENLDQINVSKALDIAGVKYLILRKDEFYPYDAGLENKLLLQPKLKLIYKSNILNVYENTAFSGLTKIYSKAVVTNKGLAILQDLDTYNIDVSNTLISFSDLNIYNLPVGKTYNIENGEYIDAAIDEYRNSFIFPAKYINLVESGKRDFWRKSSLKNISYAENKFFFNNYGLDVSQFDYDEMVATAQDGKQLIDKSKSPSKLFSISFSKHPNITAEKNSFYYKSAPKDFEYHWDIIRSDLINVSGVQAIKVKFKTDIKKDLIPHFKITSYDETASSTDIKFIYPDEKGEVDEVIGLPEDAIMADFSIWTLSNLQNQEGYSY
ncbi:MAG: hypothetical protein ABIJ36_01960, partial [Patescibacteria group bacterium]